MPPLPVLVHLRDAAEPVEPARALGAARALEGAEECARRDEEATVAEHLFDEVAVLTLAHSCQVLAH